MILKINNIYTYNTDLLEDVLFRNNQSFNKLDLKINGIYYLRHKNRERLILKINKLDINNYIKYDFYLIDLLTIKIIRHMKNYDYHIRSMPNIAIRLI